MVFTVPLNIYFGTYEAILQGVGKTKELAIITIFAAIIYLIGVPIAIKYLGIAGVALMFVLLYMILGIICSRVVKRLNIPIQSTFILGRALKRSKRS